MFFIASSLLVFFLYVNLPLKHYDWGYLHTFDYGILFESTRKFYLRESLFLYSRGVHALADNQEYFQFLLSPLHALNNPHVGLIAAHSIAIYSMGFASFFFFRKFGLIRYFIPFFIWLSPQMFFMNFDLIHSEAFATIMLFSMFYTFYIGKFKLSFLFLLLSLSIKEDVAFSVIGLSVYGLLFEEKWNKKYLLTGLCASSSFFCLNFFVALPYFKLLSCKAMDPGFSLQHISYEPVSPFFTNIFQNLFSFGFLEKNFLSKDSLVYLLKSYWPLLLCAFSQPKLLLLPAPALAINLLGGGYLIAMSYHYDHSSFAMILIGLFLSFERSKVARKLGFLTCLLPFLLACFHYEGYRDRFQVMLNPAFYSYEPSERVYFLEKLVDSIPEDVVLSADYHLQSYFSRSSVRVYRWENPFESSYFGVYGVCTEMKPMPVVDIIALDGETRISEKLIHDIDSQYDIFTFSSSIKEEFKVLILNEARIRPEIELFYNKLLEMGFKQEARV